jgi:hypothetical protein
MREIDQFDDGIGFAGEFVDIHLGFEEKTLHILVGFEQGAAGLAQNLVAEVIELARGEPRAAIVGGVERADGGAENVGEEPLAEIGAQAGGGIFDVAVFGRAT